MKKYRLILLIFTFTAFLSSCSDWLEVYPQNDQVSDYYWSSKEEVDAVVNSGYFYLRNTVTDLLIPLGELRAGSVYSRYGNNLQSYRVKPTDKAICNWGPFYQVVNVANSVLRNAQSVMDRDETYDQNVMKSHMTEAYFLRALSYFYLVRNWRDVPLILDPYETDEKTYHVKQSSEQVVIEQIKADILAAINSGAAKEHFEKSWENKGRATKWALYALMADVCLWSEDYAKAAEYCDLLINSTSVYAPRFLTSASHSSWFGMFNPGNSIESVFEIQWNYEEDQVNNLPVLFDNVQTARVYEYTPKMLENFTQEYQFTQMNMLEAVRTMYGGYYVSNASAYETATNGYVWKYCGSTVLTEKRTSERYDPNFIIYRMADVLLMKAEALILMGKDETRWNQATELINKIRIRSNLEPLSIDFNDVSIEEMLKSVLYERQMELAGEGKMWYDILRFGRRDNYRFKEMFLTGHVLEHNNQASTSWLRSVLNSNDALFLPVWDEELDTNPLLIQNPYYN